MDVSFAGIDLDELDRALAAGTDHGDNPIESFVDPNGGWPLRCCLTDSVPGDRIAIIAWSPMPWTGAYAETGPIVVHADGCDAAGSYGTLPNGLDTRAMTLRPYGFERRITYHLVRHLPAGGSIGEHVRELLDDDAVDFVHGRNATGGCYAFTARRNAHGSLPASRRRAGHRLATLLPTTPLDATQRAGPKITPATASRTGTTRPATRHGVSE